MEVVGSVVVAVAVLAFLWVWVWSLFDVAVRATDLGVARRVTWVILLISLYGLGAALYVRFGPGRERWAPWAVLRAGKLG